MSEKFLGQIMLCGFDFPPRGFAQCNGQLLAIAQNQALFSLLGTTYGGNGVSTFALPDLRGRTPVGFGSSVDPGWQGSVVLGQVGGQENVTLTTGNMPSHTHQANASTTAGNNRIPSNRVYATSTNTAGTPIALYAPATGTPVAMNPQTVAASGSNQPHPNMQPYGTINFCIALQGFYPSRN